MNIRLILGHKTQLTTIICWILLVSVQNRNPLILTQGDTLLRLALFFSMGLPLGEYYSLDYIQKHRNENLDSLSQWDSPIGERKDKPFYKYKDSSMNPDMYIGAASFGFIAQLACVYLISSMMKYGLTWQDGSALYYTLR
jgi:hypothetical protein